MNKQYNKNTDIAHKVLAQIEKENMHPRSKWYFILVNDFFWILGALSIVIGAFSFAIILFTYFNAEPELYRISYDSFLAFIFDWVPVLWMVVFGLFMYVGYKNIQHTKHGYKYSFSAIVLATLVLSCMGGITIYLFGFAPTLDNAFERHVPMYRSVHGLKREITLRPQRGIVAGEIISIAPDSNSFTLQDFKGGVWIVSTQALLEQDKNNIAESLLVRVIGVPSTTTTSSLATSTIYGCAVLPWKPELKEKIPPHRISGEMMRAVIIERKENTERNNICKGVQPYLIIQEIRNKKDQ